METGLISLVLSGLAFSVSAATAWFTLWRRGSVRMTRPALIFFGPDGSRGPAKVFLRMLLYSTAERGHIVETMYVRLRRGGETHIFSTWILRESGLSRGSGLFVDRRGIASDHHFLLPQDGSSYEFAAGSYVVEVFVSLVAAKSPLMLTRQVVSISEHQADAIRRTDAGLFFDWNPAEGRYENRVDRNRTAELNELLSKSMQLPNPIRLHEPISPREPER